MEQRLAPRNRSLTLGVLTQLALSHFLAGGCALIAVSVIGAVGIRGLSLPVVAALAAALLGLALTLNLQRCLHLLDLTLAHLVAGLPVATVPRGAWPLRRLFISLGALSTQARERAEDERHSAAYRERLLRQVSETAAQEERNRLARDLHDSIKQQLFSISVSVAAARARHDAATPNARDPHDELLDEIAQRAQEAQVEMQALLLQLRPTPLEQIGLVEALRVQAEALGYRSGAQVTVELGDLPAETRLPPVCPARARIGSRGSSAGCAHETGGRAIAVMRCEAGGPRPRSTLPRRSQRRARRHRPLPVSRCQNASSALGSTGREILAHVKLRTLRCGQLCDTLPSG
jgi:histidine kinase